MALLVPDDGEIVALEYLVGKDTTENLDMRLFQSNTTPAEADTLATYTESTWTGYASIALTGASWTTTTGAPSDVAYAQQTYTSSADQASESTYGYLMKRVTTGDLILAERFTDGPYAIANNGDAIKITPQITAD